MRPTRSARNLSNRLVTLYQLGAQILVPQTHYDFGLRSLKSVLVMAGGLKREYSDLPEDLVLMRVLRDSNMPKYYVSKCQNNLHIVLAMSPSGDKLRLR